MRKLIFLIVILFLSGLLSTESDAQKCKPRLVYTLSGYHVNVLFSFFPVFYMKVILSFRQ